MDWVDYKDETHPSVVALVSWIGGLLKYDQVHIWGQIDALMELAAAGEIPFDPHAAQNPRAQIVPIRDEPELYELRWKFLSRQVRQYHGEPPSVPTMLAALHVHMKQVSPTQEQEIDTAAEVYSKAHARGWAPEAS